MTAPSPTHPETYVRRMGAQYPDCWRRIEMMRQQRGKGLPDWPDWCYCPMAGAMAVATGGSTTPPALGAMPAVAALAALAAWRRSKGIYRIDADMLQALWATPVSGDIPAQILYRLPEWCLYVDLAGHGKPMQGFFVHLEWDANTAREELRLLIDRDGSITDAVPIHLHCGGVAGGLRAMTDEARRQMFRRPEYSYDTTTAERWLGQIADRARAIEPLVSIVLYICTQAADITQRTTERTTPRPHRRKAQKDIAAQAITTWDVGLRIGARLRHASASSQNTAADADSHPSPRAHVRRAHWHTYWTGPRDAQTPVLRWLSPILVGAHEDLIATVHPVEHP